MRMCRVKSLNYKECFISYRKYTLQITQPSIYRCTQLQRRLAVISEAPSSWLRHLFRYTTVANLTGFSFVFLQLCVMVFQAII